jgi:tRNA pseudouridine38-40 synthase
MRLTYDGTRYHGWQRQKNAVTVQETVETALFRALGEQITVQGCGRTDAGVHALDYCADFFTDSRIPPERLPFALNAELPPDIAVKSACYTEPEFNSVLSCAKKEYKYRIFLAKLRDPFETNRSLFYPYPLRLPEMRKAARQICGTHDFAALRSVGTETKSTVRTVHWIELDECENALEIRICANGFLYNMARAIAGTLLYVSESKLTPEDIPAILESGDRRRAGPTAPPQGLYMNRLWYGEVPSGEPEI